LRFRAAGYRFAEKARLISEEEESLVVESHSRTRVVIDESFQDAEKAAITTETAARGMLRKAVFGATMLVLVVAGSYWYLRRTPKLTDKDMLVLADFANTTGDPVFDGALRQGLSVQLEQSPFLNVLSNQRIAQTLSLMTQPKDSRLSPELAREVCQRTASTAVLDGTIAQIGTRYLLTLTAINCSTGDMLASAEAKADDKDHVLDALGTVASDIRPKLGESLATVRKFDVTLRQATTSSLEALKALTVGEKFLYQKDTASAVPYFQRALELDPNFAMAYMQLGITYYSLSEPGRAKECFAKAFLLREHTSEREKLQIASAYYGHVTGEIDKAIQALQEVIEIYKHSSSYNGLTDLYARLGQYEKSADAARMLLTLDSYKNFGFVGLALDDMALQNFSGARQIIQQAQARAVDSYFLHIELYTLSFLQVDSAGMAEQQRWFASQPVYENYGLALAADTEAYAGHLKKARELTRLASDSAVRVDNKEDAAMYRANGALREAAYGNPADARQAAAEALKLAPGNPGIAVQAALALAMTGETARAASLVQDLEKRFPLDTQLQMLGVPAMEAQLQLGRHEPELALNTLRAGLPIEFANTQFSSINTSCLYPTYIRGQAYLAAGQGSAAVGEFQKIVDHNGIVGNCWTGALAHLELGRANVLLHDSTKAKTEYQNFLSLWKDADPDIPILKQARAESAKLQ